MNRNVIDVSYHNGVIDWEKVKAAGVEGAILRCGYGMDQTDQDDKQFKRNADECTRLGIPFGVYLYSYANNARKAESEAQHVLRLIAGYKLSYPVYYDLEERGTEVGAAERMKIFADIIEAAGFWCGVYCNKSWWDNYLSSLGDRYTKWIARYNNVLGMDGVDMWQYTSDGSVSGIAGRVDMNHCYRDFPAEITGGTTPTQPPAQEDPEGSTLDLVYYTMQGKFGSGDARKAALGSRYNEVQDMINHISTASVQTLANEVLDGKYGNGDVRKTVLGSRYDEVQNQINAGSFDMTDWVRELQQECNNQGFSHQAVDGKPGKNTLAGCPTVRKNASGNITKLLQERLISLGYSCGDSGADGKFGSGTKAAVEAFQRANNLESDGIVGQDTWRKLLEL